jgi:hypothetical protein
MCIVPCAANLMAGPQAMRGMVQSQQDDSFVFTGCEVACQASPGHFFMHMTGLTGYFAGTPAADAACES